MPFVGDTTQPSTPTTWSFSNPLFPSLRCPEILWPVGGALTASAGCADSWPAWPTLPFYTYLPVPSVPEREPWAPLRLIYLLSPEHSLCFYSICVFASCTHTQLSQVHLKPHPGASFSES